MDRPICRNEVCIRLSKPSRKYKSGYSPYCSSCEKKRYGDWETRKQNPAYKQLRYKTLDDRVRARFIKSLGDLIVCRKCGFVPVEFCQMDVDHIDADHLNNEISNLQLLCSNCHRLKTLNERS